MFTMQKDVFLNAVACLKADCEEALNSMRTAETPKEWEDACEYFSLSTANIRTKITFADLDEFQKGILEQMQDYYNSLFEYIYNTRDTEVETVLF